jgi:hypothetical protein
VPRLGKRIDCTVAGCGKYQECGWGNSYEPPQRQRFRNV